MDKRVVDVAVIGTGPAGSTVALKLSKAGLSVALLGLPHYSKKLYGETLSPYIKSRLTHLGIWQDFLSDEHLPSAGNISAWGDTETNECNFIFHPDTHGWHLDRAKFDLMLLNAAKKGGVLYLETKIETVDNNFAESWNLEIRADKKTKTSNINAKFLVDATGRTRLDFTPSRY